MYYFPKELGDLSEEIFERLPVDIQTSIKNGTLKLLPKDVVNSLPEQISNSIPDSLIEAASSNPILTLILVIIGVIGVIGFLYGVLKSGFKTTLFFGTVAACAWGYFALL